MDKIIPLGVELYVNLAAFVVLFLLLGKFAFPAITKLMDERSAKIRESLEKSEDTRIEAERMLEEYKLQMAEARQEASKVIEQGKQVAEAMKTEIMAKASEEAAVIVEKAKQTIDVERKAAVAELRTSVAELSVAVAGKIIGEKLSADDHAKLIEQYVAEVGGLNDN